MSPSIITTSNIKNSTILQKVKRLKITYINHQDSTYMEFGVNWVSYLAFLDNQILLYRMIGKAYRADTGITMIIQVVVSGKAGKWKFLPQQNKQGNIDKYKSQN